MLTKLHDWTVSLSSSKFAQYWLALIALIESSFFLIPADVLFIPMSLVKPKKAYHYALIATTFSVLGGILGWWIGHYAFETIAKPVLEFYGKLETFEYLRSHTTLEIILFLLVTSGLTHLPPIKVVTILSGVVGINIWIFILSAIIARGARFYLLAWLIDKYGAAMLHFIIPRLKIITILLCVFLALAYILYKILL